MEPEIKMDIYEDAIFIVRCFYSFIDKIIETSRKDFLKKYYTNKDREVITSFENDEAMTSLLLSADNDFIEEKIGYREIEKLFADVTLYERTKGLSPKHKQVLYYLFIEKFTAAEIAKIMGLSKGRITQIQDEAFKIIRGE